MLTPDLLSVLMRGIGARDQAWGPVFDPAPPAEQADFDAVLRRDTGRGGEGAGRAPGPLAGMPDPETESDGTAMPRKALPQDEDRSARDARPHEDRSARDACRPIDGGEMPAPKSPAGDADGTRHDPCSAGAAGQLSESRPLASPERSETARGEASAPPDPRHGPAGEDARAASLADLPEAATGLAQASPPAPSGTILSDARKTADAGASAAAAERGGSAPAPAPARPEAAGLAAGTPSDAPARPAFRDDAEARAGAVSARDGALVATGEDATLPARASSPARTADPAPGPAGGAAHPASTAAPAGASGLTGGAPPGQGPAAAGMTGLAEAGLQEADMPSWRLAPTTEAEEARPPALLADRAALRPSVTPGQTGMLVRHIQPAVAGGEPGRVEIRLDPPELGRVQIELRFAEGSLHALLIAERPEAGEIMRRHADWLQREFEAAGCGSVILDFARGRDPGEGGERPFHGSGNAVAPIEARDPAAATPPRPAGNGRLDIRL